MNLSPAVRLTLLLAGSALLSGCATAPAPLVPPPTTRYSVENTEKFVLTDAATQGSVTCTGLQERLLADGRLDVVANVKNREDRRIEIQVQCSFMDAAGFPIGDPPPWQATILTENATEAVHFTATSAAAKRYTIRVRLSQ